MAYQVIYAGPTLRQGKAQYPALIGGSVYKNGVPDFVNRMIERVPEIGQMIVPVSDYPQVRREAFTPGTEYNRLYNILAKTIIKADGEVEG